MKDTGVEVHCYISEGITEWYTVEGVKVRFNVSRGERNRYYSCFDTPHEALDAIVALEEDIDTGAISLDENWGFMDGNTNYSQVGSEDNDKSLEELRARLEEEDECFEPDVLESGEWFEEEGTEVDYDRTFSSPHLILVTEGGEQRELSIPEIKAALEALVQD